MSSDRPVELRELPRGTPSTFDMPGVREDLAPKKRKRVAYKTRGREKSSNIIDQRENFASDPSQNDLMRSLSAYAKAKKPPFPLPRPKKRRDDDEGDHEYR